MEPLPNFHWAFMSIASLRLYHYLVLQPISFATGVNLNSMMCPAVSDPFSGPYYRIAANLHQIPYVCIFGKVYCIIGRRFFQSKTSHLNTEQIEEINKKNSEILKTIESAPHSLDKLLTTDGVAPSPPSSCTGKCKCSSISSSKLDDYHIVEDVSKKEN